MSAIHQSEADARWYTTNGQRKLGPFSLAQLRERALTGELQPTSMVWQEGTRNWVAANSVAGLFDDSLPTLPQLKPAAFPMTSEFEPHIVTTTDLRLGTSVTSEATATQQESIPQGKNAGGGHLAQSPVSAVSTPSTVRTITWVWILKVIGYAAACSFWLFVGSIAGCIAGYFSREFFHGGWVAWLASFIVGMFGAGVWTGAFFRNSTDDSTSTFGGLCIAGGAVCGPLAFGIGWPGILIGVLLGAIGGSLYGCYHQGAARLQANPSQQLPDGEAVACALLFGVGSVGVIVSIIALLLWLYRPLCDKVECGKIEIFYDKRVSKAEADRLGAYLVKEWGDKAEASLQVTKAAEGYQVRVFVKRGFEKDKDGPLRMEALGAQLSLHVFDGAAVEMHVCDERMQTIRAFPPRPDTRYGVVEGGIEVYYGDVRDEVDARRLAKFLTKWLGDAPGKTSVKLARRANIVAVYMIASPDIAKEPGATDYLRKLATDISVNVFHGATVELHLCDDFFTVFQTVKP